MMLVLAVLQACLLWPREPDTWTAYHNHRHRYAIEAPPGFVSTGKSFTEDGMIFYNARQAASLRVWGGRLETDFAGEVQSAVEYAQAENGLELLGQETTPQSARFAGVMGSNSAYNRMILLCDGESYAAFQFIIPAVDAEEARDVIQRLEKSFHPDAC